MSDWLKDAIFYEIYPQSFADSNGDGIGDIPGIIEHLGYVQELGCNALWLNPCFESPFGDAGYDVSDYCKVAPRYGTNDDLKRLFEEAHRRGMHVLLDLVPGHTSWAHPWFRASLEPEKNAYSGRYIWTDNAFKGFEGERSIMGSLRGLSQRDGSVAVNFYSHQPALNYGFYEITDPAWQTPTDGPDAVATKEAIKDIMRFWLRLGCDGFRVDMAHSLVKGDPEHKGTIALWLEFRAFLEKEFPGTVMVSEWGQPDESAAAGFHMDFMLHFGPSHYPTLWHAEKPYFSRAGEGDASQFIEYYKTCLQKSAGKSLICIPTGNHDMERMTKWLDEEEVKLAFAFVLSQPGAPFLYYGDEIAMRYLADVRSVEGGYYRTGARSPMQWDGSKNAGFSSGDPKDLYIPIDPDPDRPTVKKAQEDSDSVYAEVKKLIEVRRATKALHNGGEIEFVFCAPHAYPLAYRCSNGGDSVLVVINPAGRVASFPYAGKLGEEVYRNGGSLKLENGVLTAAPASAVFVREA